MDGGLDEGTDTGNGVEDCSYRTAENVSAVYPLVICRACIDGGRRCFPDKFHNAAVSGVKPKTVSKFRRFDPQNR